MFLWRYPWLAATVILAGGACGTDVPGGMDASVIADASSIPDRHLPEDGNAGQSDSAVAVDSAPGPDAGDPCPYVLYMDTAGDDQLDGSTPALAVQTLERVQEILESDEPDCDVEVRINQGTYLGQTVTWTYFHPVHAIQLMPIDYQGGGIGSIAGRPRFDGQGESVLLRLDVSDGAYTRLEFIYLQIDHYQQYALLFRGNRNDFASGWNGGNRVYGCLFQHIGNLASPGNAGYGALDLVNSRENVFGNNHFVHIENAPGDAGLMHAVYLAHGSSLNLIESNRFEGISGDPIRARDYSNQNEIRDNRFFDAGIAAFYSDWWCDMSTNPNCTKVGGECPSWENEFRQNELHCGYAGGDISTFHYFQGESYVPSWCTDHFPQGWARLYTSGNTKTCP